jgi:hypothetical protein
VADEKPPRFEGNERETLLALLGYQRESLVRKVAVLDASDAARVMVPSGTSLLWLVKHLTRAEATWVLRRFAGREIDLPDEEVQPGEDVQAAIAAYRAMSARVDDAIRSAPSLDAPCRALESPPAANLRWVVTHLLEETARHAGHADILRELIDGTTGR